MNDKIIPTLLFFAGIVVGGLIAGKIMSIRTKKHEEESNAEIAKLTTLANAIIAEKSQRSKPTQNSTQGDERKIEVLNTPITVFVPQKSEEPELSTPEPEKKKKAAKSDIQTLPMHESLSENEAYNLARNKGTVEAYQEFLSFRYPTNVMRSAATRRLKTLQNT